MVGVASGDIVMSANGATESVRYFDAIACSSLSLSARFVARFTLSAGSIDRS